MDYYVKIASSLYKTPEEKVTTEIRQLVKRRLLERLYGGPEDGPLEEALREVLSNNTLDLWYA